MYVCVYVCMWILMWSFPPYTALVKKTKEVVDQVAVVGTLASGLSAAHASLRETVVQSLESLQVCMYVCMYVCLCWMMMVVTMMMMR